MGQESNALRSLAGPSCGPGDHELLASSFGASPVTKRLGAGGDTWGKTETARTLAAGTWDLLLFYDSSSGGGPTNKIRVQVQHRDSSCNVKATLIDETAEVQKGQAGSSLQIAVAVPAVVLQAGDVITLTVSQVAGRQNVDLRYNGTFQQNATSHVVHPDEAAIDSRANVSWFELEAP